jgi:hypothetical protein
MLPAVGVDLKKWACIACDQVTSDENYWKQFKDFVGTDPSTLKIILPEVYLDSAAASNNSDEIKKIHAEMESYFHDKTVLQKGCKAAIYVQRKYKNRTRRGLILAIDLEQFDWKDADGKPIRATEGTIEERLPPRMEIRRNSPIELPHVILLYDDAGDILMGLVNNMLKTAPVAYAAALYGGGGKVLGKFLQRENDWSFIANSLEYLARKARTAYGKGKADFLFATGDGNHSLCAAKAVWNEYKLAHADDQKLMSHPARYAMVEIENIHDKGLIFEPIHQILYNADPDDVLAALSKMPGYTSRSVDNADTLRNLVGGPEPAANEISDSGEDFEAAFSGAKPAQQNAPDAVQTNKYGIISGDSCFFVEAAGGKVATVDLEPAVKALLAAHPEIRIDYIHGDDELFALAQNAGKKAVGILLPPFDKKALFRTVAQNGPLPRKSFSMGDAEEKRFYLECRKLFA